MSVSTAKADDYQDAYNVYREYLGATKTKNLGQIISRLDKTTPNYKVELKSIAETMLNMDMDYKIISAKLVGQTGDIIVLRITQQNLPKSENQDIKSAEVDALQMLRKDGDGKWKYRGSHVLSVKQLEQ